MARGGHANSGPAPDPNALRRDRDKDGEWTVLPKSGREGGPPAWPFTEATESERSLWADLWSRPQAVVWESNQQALEVALLVKAIHVAEGFKATAADRNVVQRKMTDLGLTVPGLRANRWRIVDDAEPERGQAQRRRVGASAKERLRVVEGGAS